ncbi:uncharacterized protein A4U43_C09F6470, partial [Asparagus officinalis]
VKEEVKVAEEEEKVVFDCGRTTAEDEEDAAKEGRTTALPPEADPISSPRHEVGSIGEKGGEDFEG